MSTETIGTQDQSHLTAAERAELIAHLRNFGHQQEESQELADRGSLEVAADLMRLYEDKSWVDEMPAPGRRSKVPPDDFRRFTKWAVEDDRLGLPRKRITYLARADEVRARLAHRAPNVHESSTARAVLPLRWLINNDFGDRMDEVWRDAVQLADGDSPSESEVRRALSDWKHRNLPKVDKAARAPQAKGNRARVQRWRTETEHLLYELPQLAAPILRELLAKYEEHKASLPPIEEW